MVQTKLESQAFHCKKRLDTYLSISIAQKVQLLQEVSINQAPDTETIMTQIHVGKGDLPERETTWAGSKGSEEINHLASTYSSTRKEELVSV